MIRASVLSLAVVAVLSSGLFIGSAVATDDGTQGKVSKEEVAKRTKAVLSELKWHTDYEQAIAVAKESNKPLVWIQMVGDLDGGL